MPNLEVKRTHEVVTYEYSVNSESDDYSRESNATNGQANVDVQGVCDDALEIEQKDRAMPSQIIDQQQLEVARDDNELRQNRPILA